VERWSYSTLQGIELYCQILDNGVQNGSVVASGMNYNGIKVLLQRPLRIILKSYSYFNAEKDLLEQSSKKNFFPHLLQFSFLVSAAAT
jgi:hypothetical protein